MSDDLEIIAFSTVEKLWSWLEHHHATHPGVWVQLQKACSAVASIGLHDLLEAGTLTGGVRAPAEALAFALPNHLWEP